jgi:hypothetical protein
MKRTIRVADSMSDWTMLVMTPALLLLAAAAAAAAAAVAAAVSQVVSRILRHRRNRDGSFDIVIVGEGTFVIETISATAVPDEYGGAACPPLAHGTFVASVCCTTQIAPPGLGLSTLARLCLAAAGCALGLTACIIASPAPHTVLQPVSS